MIQKKMAKIHMDINCPTQSLLTCKMNPWTGANVIFEDVEDLEEVPVLKISILALHHLQEVEEKRKLQKPC